MEQFNLEEYKKNPNRKVVTRDGRPVRIICWDLKCNTPIIVAIQWNQEREDCYCYDTIGRCTNNVGELDLFFADKEELTEFDYAVLSIISDHNSHTDSIEAFAKRSSKKLLDLARKEIEKEHSEFKPKFTYNEKDYSKLANKLIEFRNNTPLCSVSYRDGEGRNVILHYEKEIFELVKNEILKDLPKWKKITEEKQNYLAYGYLSHDGYYLSIQELKDKLPKEE